MATFRIDRQFPPETTDDDIDAAALRNDTCLRLYPQLKWIRSFYDPAAKRSLCIYETEEPELIWKHARQARLPCESVTEVVEWLPESD